MRDYILQNESVQETVSQDYGASSPNWNQSVGSADHASDRRFDEFLYIDSERLTGIFNWLGPICEATGLEKGIGKRKRRKRDLDGFRRALTVVVANALKASHPILRSVYYSRKLETYSKRNVYHAEWIRSKALLRTIDLLGQCGMVKLQTGNPKTETEAARLSTFTATDRLLAGLAVIGICPNHVRRDTMNAPVLNLMSTNDQPIPYDPRTRARDIEHVRRINIFLEEHQYELALPQNEIEQICKRKKQSAPDFSEIALHRQFVNGSWEQCGRFYGGWWQTCPSELRRHITIDGNPTVELDYSGFLTRALYHSAAIDYQDDPYAVPEIKQAALARGMDWETVRESVKKALNILINASPDDKIGGIRGFGWPKGITKARAYELIEAHHTAIADKLRSGAGLFIMSRESEICRDILLHAVECGVPVLPVHDSFIAANQYERWLRLIMDVMYKKQFRFIPVIKAKGEPSRKAVSI